MITERGSSKDKQRSFPFKIENAREEEKETIV